jgi:hypothetical protein
VARDLIAKRVVSYAGRRYRPGVGFTARPSHARVLVAAGMASYAPAPDELALLRNTYETKAGRKAHPFWREARLRTEIEALDAAPAPQEDGAQ